MTHTDTPGRKDIERKIELLAKKRDYAADVLNKPVLAWTYQHEIDELLRRADTAGSAG